MGKMIEGDSTKVLLDQITEGQVTWVPMDKEYDIVSSLIIALFLSTNNCCYHP